MSVETRRGLQQGIYLPIEHGFVHAPNIALGVVHDTFGSFMYGSELATPIQDAFGYLSHKI